MPLQWVIVDGEPRSVLTLVGLAPRNRPPAICPECGERLVLKLGRVLVPHAAHRPDVVCAAVHPETELHVNLKYHIAAALGEALRLRRAIDIEMVCAELPCPETSVQEWLCADDWNRVNVEQRVSNREHRRTPDILLSLDDHPVAAIEIFATHAVDDEKQHALDALGVPWIEIRAHASLCDRASGWTAEWPLPVHRLHPAVEWRCSEHAAEHAARVDAARHTAKAVAARVVDIYRPDGARTRHIYMVREHRVDRTPAMLSLLRDGRELTRIQLTSASRGERDAAWRDVRNAVQRDLAHARDEGAVLHDSPMRWAFGDDAVRLVDEAPWDTTYGDPGPLATKCPRRYFFAKERGEWFLAPDMREVRWDRDANDAFGAHPAWIQRRAAVREHAIATGYTARPTLAGRLRPEHFGELSMHQPTELAPGLFDIVIPNGRDDVGTSARLLVLTTPFPEEEIGRIDTRYASSPIQRVWLAHPRDWPTTLGTIPWAPAGTTDRGWPRIIVDGVGVFRLGEFATLFAGGDSRLAPAEILRRSRGRMRGLAEPER